ncbi:hypothetical protein LHYA1_G007110 [Lachnellula hyalina]|uniref:Uncharacterized protein n=1 Tax=Lachnellula hyalina TaxID=1316788 RepID=A0A8H8QVV5_9HELO|nr:uncharacterized protein LHYA1_G007110 [Lachnellula hyalina]TVY23476.1 hypothetical protein LHYA1_G007110 [Lachnellula hyalina]
MTPRQKLIFDRIPQDPEARSLIVGVAVAVYYAVSAWSQVLVWPAVQAPYYKYGWQSALALWVLVIIMTCVLRFIDIRYLLPKRLAFATTLIYTDAAEEELGGDTIESDAAEDPDSKAAKQVKTSNVASI